MAIIADTGALLALIDRDDKHHQPMVHFVTNSQETFIVPSPIVTELCYMLVEHISTEAEITFLRALTNREMVLEHFTLNDLNRAIEILEQYRDAELGMVDATVMAMAERMKIKTILTVDHRDFGLFRPINCEAFTLVPDLPRVKKIK